MEVEYGNPISPDSEDQLDEIECALTIWSDTNGGCNEAKRQQIVEKNVSIAKKRLQKRESEEESVTQGHNRGFAS